MVKKTYTEHRADNIHKVKYLLMLVTQAIEHSHEEESDTVWVIQACTTLSAFFQCSSIENPV